MLIDNKFIGVALIALAVSSAVKADGIVNGSGGASVSGTFTAGDLIVGGPGATQIQDATAVFNGTSNFIYNSWAPVIGTAYSYGTSIAPITTAGPMLKLSRTDNISATQCGNNHVDNECNATLAVYTNATSSSDMQSAAIFAGASGSNTRDEVGIYSVGIVTGAGTGIGTGGFFQGRRNTATGKAKGIEINVQNETATGDSYTTAGFSPTTALWISVLSTQNSNSACGLCFGNFGAGQGKLDVGIGITTGTVATTSFRDDSSSATAIQINGTHATAQIAATGYILDSAGNESANSVNVTGTTTPANGINLPSANLLGFNTNSTLRGSINSSGIWLISQSGSTRNVLNNTVVPFLEVARNSATVGQNGAALISYQSGVNPAYLILADSQSNTLGTQTAVASGTQLGVIDLEGSDGTNFQSAARIIAEGDNTVSAGIVPGRLRFLTATTAGTLTEAIKIDSAQSVFISVNTTDSGATDATMCRRTSNGQILSGTGTIGICLGTSSERYKHGIADLDVGIDALIRLRPIQYYLNADHGDPNKLLYGFTAEQGLDAFPRLVGFDEEGRPNTFDYVGLISPLVKAAQNHEARLRAIEERMN